MKINKIVVGVDFSPESDAAVTHAIEVARHIGAEVFLVHVMPMAEAPEHLRDSDTAWRQFMRRQLAANRERLEEMRMALRGTGVPVSHNVIDDSPPNGLIQAAEELGADLIAMGTHGYTGLQRLLLGSVAERVVRDSRRSALVTRGRPARSGGYQKILVPTDFSASAEEAVAMAVQLVAKGGSIEVRHYWHTPVFGPIPDPEELEENAEESLSQRGAALLERQQRNDAYEMTFLASAGAPKRELLDLLHHTAYDLVVMGSHGRRGLTRWLLGSVAEATVRHAPCSVLVVKPRLVL